jgi:hypothetical protein
MPRSRLLQARLSGELGSGRAELGILPEGLAIMGRGYTHHPLEMRAEGSACTETAILRYPIHWGVRGLKPTLGREDPLVEQPP